MPITDILTLSVTLGSSGIHKITTIDAILCGGNPPKVRSAFKDLKWDERKYSDFKKLMSLLECE